MKVTSNVTHAKALEALHTFSSLATKIKPTIPRLRTTRLHR
jgi:hypothetical protein